MGYSQDADVLIGYVDSLISAGAEILTGRTEPPPPPPVSSLRGFLSGRQGKPTAEDGTVYRCTAGIGEMLWPPSRLPAHFTKEE